jgi:predicted transcriptional regulator
MVYFIGEWGEFLVPYEKFIWDIIEHLIYDIECLMYYYPVVLEFILERFRKLSNVRYTILTLVLCMPWLAENVTVLFIERLRVSIEHLMVVFF